MYEKNADIMSSLAGAKDSVSKGALSLLAKLKGTSQNDIDNSIRSQLPPEMAAGIDSVRNTVQSQLPSDVSKIVDDLRNQTGGQLADKATKALSDLRTPSALSYIPGIGGALSGLAKDYPGREGIGSRLINTIPEGAAGLAGGAAGAGAGAMGGALAGPMLAPLIGRLLTRGRAKMEGSVIPNAIKAFRKVKDTIKPPTFKEQIHRGGEDMVNTVNKFFKNIDRPPIGANWNKGGPDISMPSQNAGALTGAITGGAAGTNIGSRLWRALAGDNTPEKNAELIGNQEEIDVNNNGKIEGVDLANLRKGKYEKNADIMSSLAGAKDSVSKGALSLLAKLKGTSQNDIDNSVRSQLPPDMAAGIDSVRNTVQSQLPSDVSKIVDDVRSQPMGELANKATKLLGEGGRLVGDKVEKSNAPSALSYIPGIGGYLGGLAKPTPGRGRFVSSLGEGVSGSAGAGLGSALGLTGGATLGGIGHLLMSLLSKGKYHPSTAMLAAHPAMLGGGALGGLVGGSLGTNAGAGLFRDIAARPEKSAELIGNQEEIDVNNNDKIEGADLANLRKGKKLSKDKTKFAEWTPAPSFSANMPLPEKKPNPFVQGKKPSAKADTAGAEAALAKLGSQDNCSPSRSAAGDSKGVKYKLQNEDHATGTAAFDSLDKYLRMSKKAGLNDFQTNFFGRLIQEGRNEHEIYAAVKQAGDQFGAEVGKELSRGFKKLGFAGLGAIGKGLMTGAKALWSGAGKAMGRAGAAMGEAGAGQAAGKALQTGTAMGEAGAGQAVKGWAVPSVPTWWPGAGTAAGDAGYLAKHRAGKFIGLDPDNALGRHFMKISSDQPSSVLEKLAIMGVLSGIGRGAMALGKGIGAGARGAYTGAKAGIGASSAGTSMGQAGTALGEAGQAARLAGNQARSAIGTGYQSAKGAIGTGLSDAGTAIGSGYQTAKGAIGNQFNRAMGGVSEALPGIQQGLGNAATTAGNFLGNNAKTIGAIGAGGGIAYGASQVPGAVERGVNTAVNQGIDRGMDRFSSHMQQMPGQIGGMANQAMQNLPGQLSGMANQAMQKLPQMGAGQTTGGFAGPYKQSSEKRGARNSIFSDAGRFAIDSPTENMLNRVAPYGPDLKAAVSKLRGKDFRGLLGKEVFRDMNYNVMQGRHPIGLEAMTAARNMVDYDVLNRAKRMTSLPKQVFNTMRDAPITKKILATVASLVTKRPLVAALGAGAAGGMASGAGVAGLMGLGKESSEKQAIAALAGWGARALPAIGKYMGIAGGVPGAIAKGTYTAAKGTGATTGEAIKAVLGNRQLREQAVTGASTGVMNPFTGLLATGDQDESWGHYLGRSALSGVAGAAGGAAGGRGTQDLFRRMGAGTQIGATGDLIGTIAGYDTGGMGAKGGFIGGGLLPAKVPLWMGDKAKALGGGIPGLPGRMGPTGQIGTAGNTAQLLEKLDPLSYLGSAAGSLIGKGYNAVKGNAPGAFNAAKGWAKTNPIAASIAGVGGAGLAGGAYLGNRAVNAMEGARGDVNQQMNRFRFDTNNQLAGLRQEVGGGMGGVGQFFNENKHWLMPALLAGGGALAGGAMGGGTGAALGGLSLPALYMMQQNGMFGGGGGAANPLQASAKPRADYAQQNQQYERENVDKQVAARNQDPRLASPTKPKTAGDRAVRLMRHFAKN